MLKRNDPCHCGSGKKYKKCCMNKSMGSVVAEELHQLERKCFIMHLLVIKKN
ncbi:hypothetical protein JCM19046_3789 [Bacillus sp. JCM 19046]|nr:hypothetical protein JCM19045_1364 [Bacillus sp. JCM 19045]GAF19159.1 hypothetical protein JCM19046_3789 [Bacillus sp. JCM 19046]